MRRRGAPGGRHSTTPGHNPSPFTQPRRWRRPPPEIQIDLGWIYAVDGFRYLPRQNTSQNGTIKDYEFYVSADGFTWGSPVASGTFANTKAEKEVRFTAKTGQYVRLRALSEVNGNPWTSAGESDVPGN